MLLETHAHRAAECGKWRSDAAAAHNTTSISLFPVFSLQSSSEIYFQPSLQPLQPSHNRDYNRPYNITTTITTTVLTAITTTIHTVLPTVLPTVIPEPSLHLYLQPSLHKVSGLTEIMSNIIHNWPTKPASPIK